MQYLYDDVIPPFRFFSKMVMRCVNDALDEATASRQSQRERDTETFGTTIAEDAPPSVVISAAAIGSKALTGRLSANEGTRVSYSRKVLTAISVCYSVTLCGFSNGQVVLIHSSHTDDVCETVELPIFAGVQHGRVVALSCAPHGVAQLAVAVGYGKGIFVCLTSIPKDGYCGLASKRKVRQRIVELTLAEWESDATLSSLQLSPCLSYLTVGFNNDALINLASLPPLEVPRVLRDDEERFHLGITHRLLVDGSLTSNCRGKMFFIPETMPGQLHTVFGSGTCHTSSGAMDSRRHPISLLLWLGGNGYTRCSLGIISKSDMMRSGTPVGFDSFTGRHSSGLSGVSSPSFSVSAIGTLDTTRKVGGFAKSETASPKKKELKDKTAVSSQLGGQSQFAKSTQRCFLPDTIVTAAIASANGEVVAVGCNNGKVYLMDGRGITSVLSMLPPYRHSLRLTSLFPFSNCFCPTAVQTVIATLEGDGDITLAHASGVPTAVFAKWATPHFLWKVEGLLALLPLGDLSMLLLFCDCGVYLWDIHYNCVVAKITGLPPLEPFVLQPFAGRESLAATPAMLEAMKSTSAKLSTREGSLRSNTTSLDTHRDLYLPYCTELAIFWRTTHGSLARLFIKDLIAHVYPLLDVYFPSLPFRTLGWVLNHVPPQQRHMAKSLAAVVLPAESQIGLLEEPSAGGRGAEVRAHTPMLVTPPHGYQRRLNPEDAAVNFLESTCSSVASRKTEMRRMFGSSWAQCS